MFSFIVDEDWSLFFSALVAATLFPGGSEALLVYRLQTNPEQMMFLLLVATTGNVLGSIITYAMGRFGIQLGERWFAISEQRIAQARIYFEKYGKLTLLFAWLPIIGDPICLAAGILRYAFLPFVVLVGLGKLIRYAVITWLTIAAIS